MKYTTSLRPWVARRLENIGTVDLIVGIPCYNNQSTIENVITTVNDGLSRHYRGRHALIMVSDGGSTDDTREVAEGVRVSPYIEKIVQIYRGHPGKGSALRSIFEAAGFLDVQACAVVDSDLRSITPDWMPALLQPVIGGDHDFVAPLYSRYKYDGTITNNIVYNMTRCLFGKRIRQPIGGDFGFSARLARQYALESVWDTDVARFGIDIWMTITAISRKASVCQAYLGTKIHDEKDPGESLGPMFRQVVYTLFSLMDEYEGVWKNIEGSEDVETFGKIQSVDATPFAVDVRRMIDLYREGFGHFGTFWKTVVKPASYSRLESLAHVADDGFYLATDDWARIVFDFAATFHAWEHHRRQLVDTMSSLYYARVASFVLRTHEMNNIEAEAVVEEQAQTFENLKPYLLESWGERSVSGASLEAP